MPQHAKKSWLRNVPGSLVLAVFAALAGATLARAAVFESGPVRPLALSPDGTRLFVANTPDGVLEIFDVRADGLQPAGSVSVGIEPVAVAVRDDGEVWVVNHVSDDVSVVDVGSRPPRVVATLPVGDEPSDVVFAGPGRTRAFVSSAHRGQSRPGGAESTVPGTGRADVWVFDTAPGVPGSTSTPMIATFFGDTPRALAVSPAGDRVFVAVFRSGNGTTVVGEDLVCDGGAAATACRIGDADLPGGLPAPNVDRDGIPGPETGLVVRNEASTGRWLDGEARDWSAAVRFSLPDQDVFEIDPATLVTRRVWAHVGTVLFAMSVHPSSGRVYVSNTEARNEVRFEGHRAPGRSSVQGRLHEARVTVLEDDGSVRPRHLNKHVDYDVVPSPPGTRERSLATPLGSAVSADGTTLWLAAFGSGEVAFLHTSEIEDDSFVPDVRDRVRVTGGGPSSVVPDEPRGRLYVATRFDDGISVVDLATRREIQHIRMHSPEPREVVVGRRIFYDARASSTNGEASCASCHIFADQDGLAWDLGDPDGATVPNANEIHSNTYQDYHPLKGPMTTQTLRGMVNGGPMHWRGDRTGADVPGGDGFDEVEAFARFAPAFHSLLGRKRALGDARIRRMADFVLAIEQPPNPIRALDSSLSPAEQRGRALYFGRRTDGESNCNGCHVLSVRAGFFGTDGEVALQGGPQLFKIPHLRNLHQKVGMFGRPSTSTRPSDGADTGPQVRGFGFGHDGSVDTLDRFMGASFFLLSGAERDDLVRFLLAYDSDLPPVVGQQVTIRAGSAADADARLDLLVARAGAGECELAAKLVIEGEPHGFLLDADGFRSDRAAEPAVPVEEARGRARTAGQETTFTCHPVGSGRRAAIDRDGDGHLDGDEVDAGSDPASASSVPSGATPTPGPAPTATPRAEPSPVTVRTTLLQLRDEVRQGRRMKRMRFLSSTAEDPPSHRVLPPLPGGAGDPTLNGAIVRVYGAGGTHDSNLHELAASRWHRLGPLARPSGWIYRGAPGDPVTLLRVARDRVQLRGPGRYSLDEPSQGAVAVSVRLGTDPGWCARASGQRAAGAEGGDRVGRFDGAPGPAPTTCPVLPGA